VTAPSNAEALAWLSRDSSTWPDRRLAIWGPPGCGKTHCLRVWAVQSGAAWQDGPGLRVPPPPATALAIDDADAAPDPEVLLHTLNHAAAAGTALLLSARLPPARWPVGLPDLVSRLRAITAVEIRPPEDSLLRALLARLLSDGQLSMPSGVQEWLLLRLPRTAAALREAVARLDRAQLATGRAITRGLAAAIVAEMDDPAEPA
jgi:chromosomal replication initiation ATPase DnaA